MPQGLTKKQVNTLKILIELKNAEDMALAMRISVGSVNKRLDRISSKLELKDRLELIKIVDLVLYGGTL